MKLKLKDGKHLNHKGSRTGTVVRVSPSSLNPVVVQFDGAQHLECIDYDDFDLVADVVVTTTEALAA